MVPKLVTAFARARSIAIRRLPGSSFSERLTARSSAPFGFQKKISAILPCASCRSTMCWRTATVARTVPLFGCAVLGAAWVALSLPELVLGALFAWAPAPAPAVLEADEGSAFEEVEELGVDACAD